MNNTFLILYAIFSFYLRTLLVYLSLDSRALQEKYGNYKLTITVKELKSIMDPIVGLFPRRFL